VRKSLSRNLYLIGLGLIIVATALLFAGIAGSQTTTDASGYTQVTSLGNPALFTTGIVLYIVAGIIDLIAWIGALVKMAQLGRWGWFICLLLFSGIAMLIYIFAGPETPAASQVTAATYPQQGYPQPDYQAGYPPPSYPQQGGYPPPGYPQQGNYPQQGGYPQQGDYPPPGYPQQGGYPQPGYPQQGGYPPDSYPQPGNPQGGYPPSSYPQQ